jgi:ABC-2 type transport system ATP-binding protein
MITIHQLQKRFGKTAVLQDLELTVPTGKISALLGPNGTGKTTTIKCAMNLISPDAGSIEVYGVAPNKLTPAHWQRIGYVSENQKMPDWLSIAALLDYLRPLYEKHWDRSFEKKLLADFDLPMHQPLRTLSRGQRMKAALLSSLAYRPQLVVLDEPFAGLDPLVREEFLEGLLELTETEGWTVWISSHDMEEVERFADHVAIMDGGKIQLSAEVASIQQVFRKVELFFPQEPETASQWPREWMGWQSSGRTARFTVSNYEPEITERLCRDLFPSMTRCDFYTMSLRETFIALAKKNRREKEVSA